MKKLMVTLAAVAMGVAANAAQVTWGSGTVYLPVLNSSSAYQKAAGSGTFTGKDGGTYSKVANMLVWEITATDWADYNTGKKDIWADYQAGTLKAADAYTGKTGTTGAINVKGQNYGETDQGYALVLMTYASNGSDVDYYIAKAAETEVAVGTGKTIGNLAGVTSTDVSAWQSVPEPTSGLLLLLGVAGLALRRRRA